MTKDEALKLAIQLRDTASGYWTENEIPIIEKLIALLAQPEQEPVAYYHPQLGFYWTKPTKITAPTIADVEPLPLYTAPPKREWVGLTEQEAFDCFSPNPVTYSKNIEDKLKEKNFD